MNQIERLSRGFVSRKVAFVVTPDRSRDEVLAFIWASGEISEYDIYRRLVRMGYPRTVVFRPATEEEKIIEMGRLIQIGCLLGVVFVLAFLVTLFIGESF